MMKPAAHISLLLCPMFPWPTTETQDSFWNWQKKQSEAEVINSFVQHFSWESFPLLLTPYSILNIFE